MSEHLKRRQKELHNWWIFIKERFSPLSHLPMMTLFIASYVIGCDFLGELNASVTQITLMSLFVLLFFLKLRFYDEIKDYETDLVINPTRPLPRGLLSLYDIKRGIEWVILFEITILFALGTQVLFIGLITIAYSLLMYREFFIGEKIRPHLTTYAMSHTFVTIFLSLTMMSALTGRWVWNLPFDLIKFSLIAWPLFNIFEFGRKTYQPSEEREGVATYSNIWTKPGAFALVMVQAVVVAALILATQIGQSAFIQNASLISISLLCFVGICYILSNSTLWGKAYRAFSSFYIILIYASFLFYKM